METAATGQPGGQNGNPANGMRTHTLPPHFWILKSDLDFTQGGAGPIESPSRVSFPTPRQANGKGPRTAFRGRAAVVPFTQHGSLTSTKAATG